MLDIPCPLKYRPREVPGHCQIRRCLRINHDGSQEYVSECEAYRNVAVHTDLTVREARRKFKGDHVKLPFAQYQFR